MAFHANFISNKIFKSFHFTHYFPKPIEMRIVNHVEIWLISPVLPDGLFSNPRSHFWENLEGLGMENVVIFYNHLEYFTAIWYNLWPFGIGSLWSFGTFFPFWYVWTKKHLATLLITVR
jgi:hypothetical protein